MGHMNKLYTMGWEWSDAWNSQVFWERKLLVLDSLSSPSRLRQLLPCRWWPTPHNGRETKQEPWVLTILVNQNCLSVLEYLPTLGLLLKAVITFFPFWTTTFFDTLFLLLSLYPNQYVLLLGGIWLFPKRAILFQISWEEILTQNQRTGRNLKIQIYSVSDVYIWRNWSSETCPWSWNLWWSQERIPGLLGVLYDIILSLWGIAVSTSAALSFPDTGKTRSILPGPRILAWVLKESQQEFLKARVLSQRYRQSTTGKY